MYTEKGKTSVNKCILVGRLVKDPELKFSNQGTAVATFTLAVDRKFVNQTTGQREADFINIVAWKGLAETIANYCKKGQRIGITGRINTRTYQAQDGSNRHVTEVIAEDMDFLESKKGNQGGSSSDAPEGYVPMDDEDIPF